eukprot:scaffold559_cov149-Skeletonema_menzelii.AAC.8
MQTWVDAFHLLPPLRLRIPLFKSPVIVAYEYEQEEDNNQRRVLYVDYFLIEYLSPRRRNPSTVL